MSQLALPSSPCLRIEINSNEMSHCFSSSSSWHKTPSDYIGIDKLCQDNGLENDSVSCNNITVSVDMFVENWLVEYTVKELDRVAAGVADGAGVL